MTTTGALEPREGLPPMAASERADSPVDPPQGAFPWTPWRELWTWTGVGSTGILLVPGWWLGVLGFWPAWVFAAVTTVIWFGESSAALHRCHNGLTPLWAERRDDAEHYCSRRTLFFLWWPRH